jgi:hypothetical protein
MLIQGRKQIGYNGLSWVSALLTRLPSVVFVVMEDYPRNLQEFNARFSSDEDCREYLCQLRWPEGFHCPR